jgi:hypothetical protein
VGPPAGDQAIAGLAPASSLKAALSGGRQTNLKRVA